MEPEKADVMESAGEKNSAMSTTDGLLLEDLKRIATLDLVSAKQELEQWVCSGACEGWLFENSESVEKLMFHLLIGLHDAATNSRDDKIPNVRDTQQAQEALVEIALYFIKAKPGKKIGSEWLRTMFDLPHFKAKWDKRIHQSKAPNTAKLAFVLKHLTAFDDSLMHLVDKMGVWNKETRKWTYLPLSSSTNELRRIAQEDRDLSLALEFVLSRIHEFLPVSSMAFENYLSRSEPEFLDTVMPWLESKWRKLTVADRKQICGSKAPGQQNWGKVRKHIGASAKIVVRCTLASGECISTMTLERVLDFVG